MYKQIETFPELVEETTNKVARLPIPAFNGHRRKRKVNKKKNKR